MQATTEFEFKTLLTKEEYTRLINQFAGNKFDDQTNHYFDTPRFSLKALDASLRVRERDGKLTIAYKRKKGYTTITASATITEDEFKEIKDTGIVKTEEIVNEISSLIGSQLLVNYFSLSTKRMYLPYKNGTLFIDESNYLNVTDYELDYVAKSYHQGKEEFVELIRDLSLLYKKADKKIKRAFNAYKMLH